MVIVTGWRCNMKVKCIGHGGAVSFNGFHDGGIYEVFRTKNALLWVLNDNRHERAIIPGDSSPHIKDHRDNCCGHFELVADND